MKHGYDFKYFEFSRNDFVNPEKYGGFDIYQVGELEMTANACIERHMQVCFEISYIISGEGIFTTDSTEIPVKGGDIHIIAKDAYHTIESAKDKGLRFAFLGFSFNREFDTEKLGKIKELFLQSPERTVSDTAGIGKLFTMLIDESYNGAPHCENAVESIITYILILTERLFSGTSAKKFIPEKSVRFIGQPLYDIIRFIDKTTPRCPPVREICERFRYSESYISHLFKNNLGIGISEYIIDSKLCYGEMLLVDGKHTVSEIAHITGYASPQSFCKAFRKKFGMSPTEYTKSKKQIRTHT